MPNIKANLLVYFKLNNKIEYLDIRDDNNRGRKLMYRAEVRSYHQDIIDFFCEKKYHAILSENKQGI